MTSAIMCASSWSTPTSSAASSISRGLENHEIAQHARWPAGQSAARLQGREVSRQRGSSSASDSCRISRAASESFAASSVHETIVFFGSARITPDGPLGRYYQEARELARLITSWSKSLQSDAHRYVVCSGGGPGIMEAANRGASDAGGRTIGLNIGLPHEQRPNPYITRGAVVRVSLFLHAQALVRASRAGAGGVSRRLRHARRIDGDTDAAANAKARSTDPVLLYGSQYWKEIINFDALVRHGTISPEDLELFKLCRRSSDGAAPAAGRISRPA